MVLQASLKLCPCLTSRIHGVQKVSRICITLVCAIPLCFLIWNQGWGFFLTQPKNNTSKQIKFGLRKTATCFGFYTEATVWLNHYKNWEDLVYHHTPLIGYNWLSTGERSRLFWQVYCISGHVWRKGEVCTRFWWGNLGERAIGETKT